MGSGEGGALGRILYRKVGGGRGGGMLVGGRVMWLKAVLVRLRSPRRSSMQSLADDRRHQAGQRARVHVAGPAGVRVIGRGEIT